MLNSKQTCFQNNRFNKSRILVAVSIMILLALFFISLCIGKYRLLFGDILKILNHTQENLMAVNVFYTLRLPRSIMAVLAGFGLSMAGSVYQTIFKNPLASPDIIGVTSGANVGAALCIVLISGNMFIVSLGAFLGGIIAITFVIGLVKLSGTNNIQTYVLSGIVISALSNGIIMTIKYFSDPENELGAIEFWTMGSLGSITATKLIMILPFLLIGVVGILLMRWDINLLSLSDDEGKALGISVERSRFLVLLFSTLVVASIVSVTGLISFVALIPPHIARTLLQKNNFTTILFSGILGAILMTFSDCLARSLLPSELPISIITSFIGAPYLAFLVCKKNLV